MTKSMKCYMSEELIESVYIGERGRVGMGGRGAGVCGNCNNTDTQSLIATNIHHYYIDMCDPELSKNSRGPVLANRFSEILNKGQNSIEI